MKPVLISRETNHFAGGKALWRVGRWIAQRRQFTPAIKICMSCSAKPSSFAVPATSRRAGRFLAAQVAIADEDPIEFDAAKNFSLRRSSPKKSALAKSNFSPPKKPARSSGGRKFPRL